MTLTPNQNKIAAILLFIVLVPLELLLLVLMISIFFSDEKEKVQTVFTFIFVMAIFLLPLRWAYLIWKRQKPKPVASSTNANVIIKFQTKINLPEYRQLLFLISYSNSVFIYLHIIAIGMFFFVLLNGKGEWFGYFGIIFVLYLAIAIYRNANSNFKTTKTLHETLSYEFNLEGVTVIGQTFNSTIQWNSFHKVREFKKWFLLYTNKQIAMLIPKRAFNSPSEMESFRALTNKIG